MQAHFFFKDDVLVLVLHPVTAFIVTFLHLDNTRAVDVGGNLSTFRLLQSVEILLVVRLCSRCSSGKLLIAEVDVDLALVRALVRAPAAPPRGSRSSEERVSKHHRRARVALGTVDFSGLPAAAGPKLGWRRWASCAASSPAAQRGSARRQRLAEPRTSATAAPLGLAGIDEAAAMLPAEQHLADGRIEPPWRLLRSDPDAAAATQAASRWRRLP